MNKENKDKKKSLRELNEEKKIIKLEWWRLSNSWNIGYLSGECEKRDLNLTDFEENIKYLVNLEELRVSSNNLQHLDLSNCVNLNKLYLGNNEVIKVTIPTENKIEYLSIYNMHELEDINLEVLNPEYLNELSLFSNDKLKLKTIMFSKFVNLKELYISDANCSGSLIHLRNLIKLENIWMNNTNILPSFEYLSDNVSIYLCFASINDCKWIEINKFLTIENNMFLGRDMNREEFINIAKFKVKHPTLAKNGQIVISLYEELVQINKDKKYLDRCLTFLEQKNVTGIEFRAETEFEKSQYFYSNYYRFSKIYDVFSNWLYDKNKELNDLNKSSLNYYSDLIEEKIEYSPLITT
ncbi:MAG: hypothetical protein AM1032_000024 [Mycoplasmataceae bacterium]|nr:MAG: hypothetical protein AM1032_000024 [Mycoplasmataceae bacterium]